MRAGRAHGGAGLAARRGPRFSRRSVRAVRGGGARAASRSRRPSRSCGGAPLRRSVVRRGPRAARRPLHERPGRGPPGDGARDARGRDRGGVRLGSGRRPGPISPSGRRRTRSTTTCWTSPARGRARGPSGRALRGGRAGRAGGDDAVRQPRAPELRGLWEPFTLGVGPAGAYAAGLDPGGRRASASAAASRCPSRRSCSPRAPGRRAPSSRRAASGARAAPARRVPASRRAAARRCRSPRRHPARRRGRGAPPGMRQMSPGPSSRVSSPTRNDALPRSMIPNCSFAWSCSGRTASGSISTTASVSRSPWTARARKPSKSCRGAISARRSKALQCAA